MRIIILLLVMFSFHRAVANEPANGAQSHYAPMAVFEALAGKSWRGEGTGPNGKPVIDVAKYEMILGGRAFQSTHKLENADYGGRTIMFFDEGAQQYIFHYFTTAGFHATGVIEPTPTGFKAVEKVQNHPVYDEVLSEIFVENGALRVVSGHKDKDGNMTQGAGIVYQEIDDPGTLY